MLVGSAPMVASSEPSALMGRSMGQQHRRSLVRVTAVCVRPDRRSARLTPDGEAVSRVRVGVERWRRWVERLLRLGSGPVQSGWLRNGDRSSCCSLSLRAAVLSFSSFSFSLATLRLTLGGRGTGWLR